MELMIHDMNTVIGRAEIEEYKAEKSANVNRGQQIYAKIKRTSKYYGQGPKGALFPVFIEHGTYEYVVQGGPGGQYRLRDVSLFVVDDGHAIRIS